MDGLSQRSDQLHKKPEGLIRSYLEHNDGWGAATGRKHKLLALLNHSGTKNPARMWILALIAWDLRSICFKSSNRGFTRPLLINRVLLYPFLVFNGRHTIIRRHLCL